MNLYPQELLAPPSVKQGEHFTELLSRLNKMKRSSLFLSLVNTKYLTGHWYLNFYLKNNKPP